jgi:hypothetical protein
MKMIILDKVGKIRLLFVQYHFVFWIKKNMIKFLKKILIILVFLFPLSKAHTHEKIANSMCNAFINKIIENYDQIKDHYYLGSENELYGFSIENTWDPNLLYEYDDGTKTIGDIKFKRDNEGNIFILNVYPNYASKVNFKPGDKIIEINKTKTKNYTDEEINKILDDKDNKVEISFVNNQNQKFNETLKTYTNYTISKYLDFKINSFNSINNRTFETDFIIEYSASAEMYDGVKKDDYSDMDNDLLFKLAKETFYKKNGDDEWYAYCQFTDEEVNQMQLFSPGWDVKLRNLSFKSKDTSDTNTSLKIYDEINGYDFESVDVVSTFKGQVRVKNNFDLRNFPFDKQKIVFSFYETADPDVVIEPLSSVYSNLDIIKNKENLINGWNLIDYRLVGHNYQEQGFFDDKFANGLDIILEIERESSYYVYKIILPIILILMVCWSVIWITPRELEARLTVTIVCLLSLIAYNFVIDSEIPKLEYLTIMDWIIFTSYIFATVPNFLCIISHKLYNSNKSLCLKIENRAKFIGPMMYIAVVLLIISYNVNIEPEHSAQALKVLAK